ncbi:hypothetical protein [Micromonospora sp. NPDC004704]
MATTEITPLDPTSPKGVEVAERLTEVFAQIRLRIAERKRREAQQSGAAA